ncbi:hypothetical protein [Streptomyces sp. NPDC055692]|uniref:hypothetical protein n=1 Tax=Streptomyces sp. NPDC055692 TaxID=3155683 RepID=UPI003428C4FC
MVRCRVDFTYAPAMEPDGPGFHHSVLAAFRERLARVMAPTASSTLGRRRASRTVSSGSR